MDKSAEKNKVTVKRTQSAKAESETQTAVAVRVPSLKKRTDDEIRNAAEKIVTDEQVQNASTARKRRIITKNRAQGVRNREKTPEPSKSAVPHEDTTTTDDEDQKNSKPTEAEADDIYAETKRKIQEKMMNARDDDDIDIDAIREAQAEEAKERRRRSISPFALPTKEEIESLRRKSSFVDPTNKLLSTIPTYALTPKDDSTPSSRKNSFTEEEPSTKVQPNNPIRKVEDHKLITPPISPVKPDMKECVLPAFKKSEQIPKRDLISNLKPSTNISIQQKTEPSSVATNPQPIKPKRSKSGTRSQGRTSESEMSEDQTKQSSQKPQLILQLETQLQLQSQIVPKPKERRRTIAAIKRSVRERSPNNRSRSATRPNYHLDTSDIEMTKTTSEIIDLLQKAHTRSLSIPIDDLKASIVCDDIVDRTKQLMTPNKTPTTPKKPKRVTTPKMIEIMSEQEMIESFRKAQRKSMETERSRRSSGYIDASQSEITSSCYSSSYSEDESDFDLSKKSAELTKKLKQLHMEKEAERNKLKHKIKEKVDVNEKVAESKPIELSYAKNASKKEIFKAMCKNFFKVLKAFRKDNPHELEKIREIRNKCFNQLIVILIFCGLGGVIFRYTEGAFENFYKCGVKRVKRDFIDTLWQGSHNLKEEDWKSVARKKLWEFESQLHVAHEAGVHSYSGQKAWSFLNSAVYCITVVTTIGYGHIAPSTTTGRAITIIYAIIGIPLFLILLADFGKLFTRCLKFLWAFVRRLYYTGSCRQVRKTAGVQEVMKGLNIVYEAASTLRRPSQFATDEEAPEIQESAGPPGTKDLPPKPGTKLDDGALASDPQTPAPSIFEIDDEFNLPISVAITCLVIYIFAGASIYVVWEEWSFFESFYFVFISMSTIGFGDFVPNHPMFMMCSIVYLVFGMALTSMCINVVQVKLSDSFRQASAKIGATIGLKVCEEDGSLGPMTPAPVPPSDIHVD